MKSKVVKRSSLQDTLADGFASVIGSWGFVLFMTFFIIFWITFNSLGPVKWDPYPFILLNLALSFQAAYAMPIIMMSQNRVEERDRRRAEADYKINKLAEKEIEEIIASLERTSKQLELSLLQREKLELMEERLDKVHSYIEAIVKQESADLKSK